MSDWKSRAIPAELQKASWKDRAVPVDEPTEGKGLLDSAKDFGQGILQTVGKVGRAVDSYTGAPVRAAIGAAQEGNNPIKAYGHQFGGSPEDAPSGKQIAQKAGVPDSTLEAGTMSDPLSMGVRSLNQLGYNPSLSDAAGAGIDMAADPVNLIPFAGEAKGLLKSTGIGEKAGLIASKIGKIPGKIGTKVASTLTGAPEADIANYASRTGEVNKLLKDSGGDLTDAADKVREGFQGAIRSKKDELRKTVETALSKLPDEKSIDVTSVVDHLEKKMAQLKGQGSMEQVGEMKSLLDKIKGIGGDSSASAAITGENQSYKVTPKELFGLKNYFQDVASPSYMQGGQIFNRGNASQNAAKSAGAETRKLLNTASDDVASANNQLSQMHTYEKNVNKNMLAPGKSDSALMAAGSGNNPRNSKMLQKMGDMTGYPIAQKAKDLSTARTFANPGLLPMDHTGKAFARQAAAGLLGEGMFGHGGAMIAMGLSSPAALKAAINTGKISMDVFRKLTGGAKIMSEAMLNKAYQAIQAMKAEKGAMGLLDTTPAMQRMPAKGDQP